MDCAVSITLTATSGPNHGARFTFDAHETFLVGRAVEAHFRLPETDLYFSRAHFLIELNPPLCRLIDMNSNNGTFVNGKKCRVADLKDGDIIQAGTTTLMVSLKADPPSEPTPAPSPTPAYDEANRTIVPLVVAPPSIAPGAVQFPPVDSRKPSDREVLSFLNELNAPGPIGRPAGVPVVPGYVIGAKLGEGGMGAVFEARRESDGRQVAVKVVYPKVSVSDKELHRFVREANILKTFLHPNIVQFHDLGGNPELFWFAMELVPGSDAGKALGKEGKFAVPRAVSLMCQLLDALHYAHKRGYVHRDLKPANLLLSPAGPGREILKLADFGLARTYQESRASGLTMEGDIGGTARYMPPEQMLNFRTVKPAADQYSAAATLYHLLTGAYTYDCDGGVAAQLKLLLFQDPVPIRSRRPDLPEGLATAIHRALAREPGARFPDAKAFRSALLPFAG